MSGLGGIKSEARLAAAVVRRTLHALADGAALRLAARSDFPVSPISGHSVMSGYYPYQTEIDVVPLMGWLAGEGWSTCLPIVLGPSLPLQFRRWSPGEPTVAGKWNIPRPPEASPIAVPDVLLVPMLAFDRQGHRLGYGGGFYDRTLALLRAKKAVTAIGVAYAGQEVDAVPHDGQDQRLDFVMTEKEVFRCA